MVTFRGMSAGILLLSGESESPFAGDGCRGRETFPDGFARSVRSALWRVSVLHSGSRPSDVELLFAVFEVHVRLGDLGDPSAAAATLRNMFFLVGTGAALLSSGSGPRGWALVLPQKLASLLSGELFLFFEELLLVR